MGLGGTLRRLRVEPVVAVGTLLTVTLSLVLLAAGPIYADAVAVGALRRSLVAVPAADAAVTLAVRVAPDEIAAVESIARDVVTDAFGAVDADVVTSLVSTESYELPDQPDPGRVDLAQLAWLDGAGDHVELVRGTFPSDGEPVAGVVAVAVHARAARELGLEPGRRLTVTPRSGGGRPVVVDVTGWYEPSEPSAAFWTGRDRLAEPLTATAAFRTVTFLVSRSAFLGAGPRRAELEVVAVPRFDEIRLADVGPLRRRLGDLDETATDRFRRVDTATDGSPATDVEIRTTAPTVLTGRDRTLTVARSIVAAVVLQLSVLGAVALVLVAGLGVDARRAQSSTLRARGASATQLVVQAGVDAAVVVVPVAVVAPWLAVRTVGLLDRVGPLRDSGLRLDPGPSVLSWSLVGVAAVLSVGLLVWPAVRAARAAEAVRRRRRRLVGGLQRSGVDVAVLVVAAASYWQLRSLGDDRVATVRGRFGVDPLLIAAPALGLVAGAFLALRVVPLVARSVERTLRRTRTVVPALAAWQFARRPDHSTRAVLLLGMAIAIGTFAVAYDATWSRSQAEQAAHELGADGRIEPNRRTGDSIGPLHLATVLERLPGIAAATPVVVEPATLPASDRPAQFLAVDAARADVVDAARSRPGLASALDALRERRAPVDGLRLPGAPAAIELDVDAPPDPQPPEGGSGDDTEHDPPAPFVARIDVVVMDGDGIVHRVDAGPIGTGRSTHVAPLAVDVGTGPPVTPRPPVSVLGVELVSASLPPPSREIDVRLGPLGVVDVDGSRSEVPLVDTDLTVGTVVLGFVDQRPSARFGARPPAGGVTLALTTGAASFGTAPVIHEVAVRTASVPSTLPAVAGDRWLESSNTEVGDVVAVSLGRVDEVRVEIVGAVDAVPGIDPTTTDALLVDLPSLLMRERSPGQAVRTMTEYWFAVTPGAVVAGDELRLPPVEAVSVRLLGERRSELLADPAALGALGALAIGFVAAATFAVAAFVVTVASSAEARRSEFALLQALGLSLRQHRRWMLGEQAVVVGLGLSIGTLLGWTLAHIVLPVVSLSQDGSTVFPPVSVTVPWREVLVLEVVVLAGLVAGVAIAGALRGRRPLGSALRTAVDP